MCAARVNADDYGEAFRNTIVPSTLLPLLLLLMLVGSCGAAASQRLPRLLVANG